MARLAGKVAVVTGAGGGMGRAEAKMLAAQGAQVVLTDIDKEGVQSAAEEILGSGGDCRPLEHDVAAVDGWRRVVDTAQSAYGGLNILVNNAGTISRHGLVEVPLDAWQRTLDVNLSGTMLGMQICAPLMRESGGGSIINVSSMAGMTAHYDAAYAASKWAVRGLTKVAAIELVGWGIRVNSIHPGQITGTSFFRDGPPGHAESARKTIPMQRQGTPEECAHLVAFLASEESSFITGAEISIDGGFMAGAAIWMRGRLREELAAQMFADGQAPAVA